jgi:PetM family of cytochrome b6f complex subunit 7
MVGEIFTISAVCSCMVLLGLSLGFLLIKVSGE